MKEEIVGVFKSPFGESVAWLNQEGALVRLSFGPEKELERALRLGVVRDDRAIRHVAEQVREFAARERTRFDLKLSAVGTAFQHSVWQALVEIPYGGTISYGELAERLGKPGAARAVGRANATNPIWLVVPCHRVVGASGALTGYAGGLELKERLLRFEAGAVCRSTAQGRLFD